jgi:hypothetical protein
LLGHSQWAGGAVSEWIARSRTFDNLFYVFFYGHFTGSVSARSLSAEKLASKPLFAKKIPQLLDKSSNRGYRKWNVSAHCALDALFDRAFEREKPALSAIPPDLLNPVKAASDNQARADATTRKFLLAVALPGITALSPVA